jgi:hypothetical protein
VAIGIGERPAPQRHHLVPLPKHRPEMPADEARGSGD